MKYLILHLFLLNLIFPGSLRAEDQNQNMDIESKVISSLSNSDIKFTHDEAIAFTHIEFR